MAVLRVVLEDDFVDPLMQLHKLLGERLQNNRNLVERSGRFHDLRIITQGHEPVEIFVKLLEQVYRKTDEITIEVQRYGGVAGLGLGMQIHGVSFD
jgi:hypothetical protein